MASPRVYFPNLNSLRFFAAMAVIIHHVEMTKYWFGLPNIYESSFVGGVFGYLGIILFFVLSGFLITFLLLTEYGETGDIKVKHFYFRRMLRIWPLYYLIVILGLFILPAINAFYVPHYTPEIHHHFLPKVFMFFTFLPNLTYAVFEHVPFAEQSWSVGVEEQFYLIWPLIMLAAIRKKKVLHTLIGIIAGYLIIKAIIFFIEYQYPENIVAIDAREFWHHFAIDCMAIGGIAAYVLYYNKERVLKFVFSKYTQILTYLFIAIVTVKGIAIPFVTFEFYAVPFAILILNLAANNKRILSFENKYLGYMGKISYGLYMFHNIVIVAALNFTKHFFTLDTVAGNLVYYGISIFLTIGISALSYEYFEKRFLRMKLKYSKVVSGDNVKDAPLQTAPLAESNEENHEPLPLPAKPENI